jgi:hypothetical protein
VGSFRNTAVAAMKRVQLDRNDLAILEMAFRYCRTLKAVEYAHAIGDEADIWVYLDSVDSADVGMVADHLEKLWRLATLAPDVGTEPREGTGGTAPGTSPLARPVEPLSECSGLRSSVPPSFFPESRRV